MLKEGVEKLIEKMEIISAVCIKNRKFKTKAEERLEALEKAQLKNVQKDQYYRDLEQMEARIVQHVRESLEKQNQKLEQHKKDLDTAKQDFEQKVHDYRGQVLWRIKDCEELLKERVTKQEIRDQNKSIEVRINQRIDHEIEQVLERITREKDGLQQRIKTCEIYTTDKFEATKNEMRKVEIKAGSMATTDMIKQV